MFTVIDPTTGQCGRTYAPTSAGALEQALQQASRTFATWRKTPLPERAEAAGKLGQRLRERADELAHLMAHEMGKPITAGKREIEKCASVCDYYAEHGPALLHPEPVATEASSSFVAFEPLGPILAIMPWNFPFWQAFRFAVPAVLAGNTGVLKHASNVPGCALAIASLFDEVCPFGVFQTVLVESKEVSRLIADARIAAVTLTGSTEAGRSVASDAGRALKKCVLELGGSDAYVVLADADVALAARTCATSRLINCGQSCIAAKRFIVVPGVREAFEQAFVEHLRQARVGSPTDPATEVGPLARHDLRDSLHEQVRASVEAGARCVLGGTVPDGPGAFYPPTVLTDVRPGMTAFDEELFGPVAAVVPAKDEREALELANASPFGLGGAVFTRDRARGIQIATTELAVGNAFVNDFVRSDPRLPFGGIKQSGYGRELAAFGLREFVNIKTIWAR